MKAVKIVIPIVKTLLLILPTFNAFTLSFYYDPYFDTLHPVVMLLGAIGVIVLSIISAVMNTNKSKIFSTITIVLATITALAWGIYNSNYGFPLWTIYIFLFVIVAILSIVEIALSNKSSPVVQTSANGKQGELNFNKLVEYKELLDMGIITQEEFEEKKKALLNQ